MSATIAQLQDAAGSFDGVIKVHKLTRIYFTVVFAGNYPAGGDVLDFTQLGDLLKTSRPPLMVVVQSAKSGGVSGYTYDYAPGNPATQANGKLQVFQGAAAINLPLAEIPAAAYPAGVSGDTIIGYAEFPSDI